MKVMNKDQETNKNKPKMIQLNLRNKLYKKKK
jgi:hypothetical protein